LLQEPVPYPLLQAQVLPHALLQAELLRSGPELLRSRCPDLLRSRTGLCSSDLRRSRCRVLQLVVDCA
jgi:hypothetical protein